MVFEQNASICVHREVFDRIARIIWWNSYWTLLRFQSTTTQFNVGFQTIFVTIRRPICLHLISCFFILENPDKFSFYFVILNVQEIVQYSCFFGIFGGFNRFQKNLVTNFDWMTENFYVYNVYLKSTRRIFQVCGDFIEIWWTLLQKITTYSQNMQQM